MDRHPHDLLADAVGGTLDAADRAALDAHLSGCAECEGELAAARAGWSAVEALRTSEVGVPFGVTADAVREARNALRARASRPARWAAGLAAAALVAAVGIAVFPRGGEDASGGGAMRATEAATAAGEMKGSDGAADAAMPDATDESLQNLADVAAQAPLPPLAERIDYSGAQLDCLVAELDPGFLEDQVPIQILNARYEGTDALVGTFILEEGDQRLATVRVVDASTCLGMATFLGLAK